MSARREPVMHAVRIAPVGRRAFAWLLDSVLMLLPIGLAGLATEAAGIWIGWTLPIGILSYRLLFTLLREGTLGKLMGNLAVVNESGGRASTWQIVRREVLWTVFMLIPVVNLLNIVMVLGPPDHRGFHDRLPGTVVITKIRSRHRPVA